MTLACRLPTGDAIVIRDIVTVWDVTFRRHWTLLGGIGLTVLQILDVTLQLNANSLSAVAPARQSANCLPIKDSADC